MVFLKKLLQFKITAFYHLFLKVIYQNKFSDVAFDFMYQDLVEQCDARQSKMFKCWNQDFQKPSPPV